MLKSQELSDPNSCLNRAHDDEMVFTLLARDAASPWAILYWIDERIRLGKNIDSDSQIADARNCMKVMNETRAIHADRAATSRQSASASASAPVPDHIAALSTMPVSSSATFPNPLQITLGEGRIAIHGFTDELLKHHGIILRDTGTPHPVDSVHPNPANPAHSQTEGEVYISCTNLESALALQRFVNQIVAKFQDAANFGDVTIEQVLGEANVTNATNATNATVVIDATAVEGKILDPDCGLE